MRGAKRSCMGFGGDYNPEQWPMETLERDVALMKETGVNTVTLNVFGWGAIEPEKGRYDFARLDAVFDELERSGIHVILATPTAAPPAWLFQEEPSMLKVGENGQRVVHWSRQAYCPNHPRYDREIRKIARTLAERYGRRSNLVLWHINNEYIVHCYCDYCAAAFRDWLRNKYGTLDRLNDAWQLTQWSLQRTEWHQVTPPLGGMSHTSHSLDYQRFLSDSNLRNFLAEKEEIRRITPDIPVTTNFYSLDFRGQIHPRWAPHLDVISWDAYPPHRDHAVWAAFQHDYFRGLKGRPFILMEQATNSVNWKEYNPAKRPGMMRLQSYQALARGAEAVLFFQFRQSRGGVEKFHSALISHGTEADNRVYREVRQLGRELEALGDAGRGRIRARVAVLFDVTQIWLVEWNRASRDVAYRDAATAFYRPLYEANIPVDVVHPLADLSGYEIVVAPMLYMFEDGVPERLRSFVERGGTLVMSYLSGMVNGCDMVEHGGFLRPIDDVFGITVEEWDAFEPDMANRIAWRDEFRPFVPGEPIEPMEPIEPSELMETIKPIKPIKPIEPVVREDTNTPGGLNPKDDRDARRAAIHTDEADRPNTPYAPAPLTKKRSSGASNVCEARKWAEVVRLKGAEALAVFLDDYHAGQPAVTRHRYGRGEAYYVATHPDEAFLRELLPAICRACGVISLGAGAPAGVEISVRESDGERYWFVLNHNPAPVEFELEEAAGSFEAIGQRRLENGRIALEAYGVAVLRCDVREAETG